MIRVFYAGGDHRDFEPGEPVTGEDARRVLIIVQPHAELGAEVVCAQDYYVRDADRWRACDIFGLFSYLLDSGLVLFGEMTTRQEYNALMKAAIHDSEDMAKTGWLPTERRPDP